LPGARAFFVHYRNARQIFQQRCPKYHRGPSGFASFRTKFMPAQAYVFDSSRLGSRESELTL